MEKYIEKGDIIFFIVKKLSITKKFLVPLNLNRIPNGWQIRIKRVNQPYFSRAFRDSKYPHKMENKRIETGLNEAILTLKELFSNSYEDTLERKKVTKALFLKRDGEKSITGIQIKLVLPKPKIKETTPFIVLTSQLGFGEQRMVGRVFSRSIFSMTPDYFQSCLRKVLLERKYMEYCYLNDKPFSHLRVDRLSVLEEENLLKGIDSSEFTFERYLDEVDSRWELPSANHSVLVTKTNKGIIIERENSSEKIRNQKKVFEYKQLGSQVLTERIARLYQRFLQNTPPHQPPRMGKKNKPVSPEEKNQRPQVRTGVIGVTFWHNKESVYFVSVYWNPETGKRLDKRFSLAKYGVKNAFIMAREWFDEQRGVITGDSAMKMHFQKALPKLLAVIPQSLIDHLQLAETLESELMSMVG
jgi:hypothetical protein